MQCIRECTRTADDGELEAVEADVGLLCRPCFGRIRWHLLDAADVAAEMRNSIMPGAAGEQGERVSSSKDAPLPFRAEALEDADQLYRVLTNWVTYWVQRTSLSAPAQVAALAAADIESGGFKAGTAAEQAFDLVTELVEWLNLHADYLAWMPAVVAYHDEIVDIVRSGRARYGLSETRRRRYEARTCPVCFETTVEVAWTADAEPDVRCVTCHQPFAMPWDGLFDRAA